MPDGCAALVNELGWSVPPLFRLLQQHGAIRQDEMFRAFNMGVGLVVVCAETDAERIVDLLTTAGEPNAFRLGTVVRGDRTVTYIGAP